MGYHYKFVQVEIGKDFPMGIKCLKKVTKMIETEKLELPPISIYVICSNHVLISSKLHWELEFIINYYKSTGSKIRVHYKTVDVGNSNDMKKYIDEIYSNIQDIKPIKSIFHYALVLSDENLKDIKIDNFIQAHNGKSHGVIKFLVEGLALYRKSIGVCSTVIKWGAIDNSYITRNKGKVFTLQSEFTLTTPKTIGSLDLLVQPCNSHFTEVIFSKNIPRFPTLVSSISYQYDHYTEKQIKNYLCKDQHTVEALIDKIASLLQIEKDKINLKN
ncbi:hypothetical protein ACTFIZ_011079 [Dictyostelium cf. discoideum]